jgi:hypothetical protein
MDIKRQPAREERDARTQGEISRRQRLKNWALAGLLLFLAVLFYFITIVRFGSHG